MSKQPLGAARLRALLDAYGIRPDRSLGQNFVIDPNTIRKMVARAGIGPSDEVLEVGPGAGSLTLELARVAKRVIAVELDGGLVAVSRETLAGVGNVELVHADAMRMNVAALGVNRLVANLPYSIAAALVIKVLEEAPCVQELTVMAQKEVGERLVASPGSKAYGLASVIVAYFARAYVAMRVSRRAFFPMPNVDSVVVRVVRRGDAPDIERSVLFDVVRAAFMQRRKTLRNSLAPVAGSAVDAERALAAAGIDPGTRPERIGLEQFAAVARALRADASSG